MALGPAQTQADVLQCTAASLMRRDLPNDFPFQVLDVGYAVVELRCQNHSSEPYFVESIEITGPNGKKMKSAEPAEIAPKLMKYYRSGSTGIHGEARPWGGYSRHPGAARVDRGTPTIGTPSSVGTVDAGTGPALRDHLESFRFLPGMLEADSENVGFVYLESKKSGRELSGGRARVGDLEVLIP